MSALAWVAAAVVAASSGFVSSRDEALDVPTFFWAAGDERVDLRAVGLMPEEAARRYLVSHAELYGASPARWARAKVAGVHDLHDGGAVIVTFQQRVEGVRVFRDELKVVMTSKLELVALSGYLTPRLQQQGTFALGPQAAVTSAYLRLAGTPLETSQVEALGLHEGDYAHWRVPGARRAVRTRATWFPSAAGLTPAFFVELELAQDGRFFSFVVSAIDGAVLYEHDLVLQHRYHAWADPVSLHPWPGPHGPSIAPFAPAAPIAFAEPTRLPPQVVDLVHAGLSTGDPWLASGATTTRGNNVDAYADVDWPSGYTQGVDALGTVTAPGDFLHPYDFTVPEPWNDFNVRAAGAVHAFYVTNFLHDWFYDDGFDEAGRNGQLSNFSRGGAGNDALLVETVDWSGTNNANMATPADGSSGRMQLFVFGGWGWPWRDGALDSGLIAHEWGHFISNRLIGDGDGLWSLQAGGLGEGWGDFHAALLLATAEDAQVPSNAQWQGTYSLIPWAGAQVQPNAFYFGFRRYPLSADLSKNPLTFRHIADSQPLPTGPQRQSGHLGPNAEVHNTGEVWAVMLWDCYVALLNDPRFTFEQARARMKRTLVASYKATPLTPTFVEARDAVLAVAAATDLEDLRLFMSAFARRGLGRDAQAPARNGQHNEPLVEDFTVGGVAQLAPLTLTDDLAGCDNDGTLDVGEQGRLTVRVRNVGAAVLTGVTVRLSASPELVFPSGTTIAVPPVATFDAEVLEVPVKLADTVRGPRALEISATVTNGSSTITQRAAFRANSDVKPASGTTDDVEAVNTLWAATNDPAHGPTRTFAREQLTGTQHVWRAPSSPAIADLRLTSPRLNVGPSGLKVTFRHRFDFDRLANDRFDGAVIELSTDDGQTWRDVGNTLTPPYDGTLSDPAGRGTNPMKGRAALVGQSANYPDFLTASLDLSAYANQALRLRFRFASDDGSRWPARGWELDELSFDGLTDTPFASVVRDPNTCTNRAPVAVVGGPLELDEATRLVLEGSATDADGDALTLTWTQTSGPEGVLQGNAFVTPDVLVDTPVTLALVADDGRASSVPAELKLVVRDVNRPPTASTPVGAQARSGERVTLTGTARDPEGDALTYEWRQVSGPSVQLEDAATPTVSLVTPQVTATEQVVLEFLARDARSASTPARSVVTVLAPAAPPEPEPMPEPPQGCGCTSVNGLALVAVALLARRRRA